MKKLYIFSVFIAILALSCAKQTRIDMKISSYAGKVTVNNGVVTGSDIPLKIGDTIETMGNSTCDIIINDRNILRLKPDTKLTLNISEKESVLKLDKGWMAGVTKKAFSKQGKFLIKTPTVAAAVRGTSFCLKVENEKSSYFCTCNGSIELQGEGSSNSETVTAAHHSAKRFSINTGGALIEDNNPGMLYHDDKGLEQLASLIGEKIDWSVPDTH